MYSTLIPETWATRRINEDQVIDSAWTPSFYGYDGGGNVRQLTNTAGAVTDSYEYDAYGNSFTVSGSTPNEMMYRGEQYDSDLGLYYLRARYYNPATGRFMSRDPYDGDRVDPKTLHAYLYVGGDPLNWVDPLGQFEIGEYSQLQGKNGNQAHHIIEQRFAKILGNAYCTGAALLTAAEHQVFTNRWRAVIPYGFGTAGATVSGILQAAEEVYWGFPDLLEYARGCLQ